MYAMPGYLPLIPLFLKGVAVRRRRTDGVFLINLFLQIIFFLLILIWSTT